MKNHDISKTVAIIVMACTRYNVLLVELTPTNVIKYIISDKVVVIN